MVSQVSAPVISELSQGGISCSVFMRTCLKVALSVLFIVGSVYFSSLLIPRAWGWAALPLVGVFAGVIASSFFISEKFPFPPIVRHVPESWPVDYSPGCYNAGKNCAFNSILQALHRVPVFLCWVRAFEEDFIKFLELDGCPDDVKNEFVQEATAMTADSFSIHIRSKNYPAGSKEKLYQDSFIHRLDHLRLLLPVLKTFYHHHESARQERLAVSKGSSQAVRGAIAQCSGGAISPCSTETVDAMEVLSFILQISPFTMQIEESLHFSAEDLLDDEKTALTPEGGVYVKKLPSSSNSLILPLESDSQITRLEDLLRARCDTNPGNAMRILDNYPGRVIQRRILSFTSLPPVFVLQIGRFAFENGQRRKVCDRLELPPRITLQENGVDVSYHLVSYVTHKGPENDGHYVSGSLRLDGSKFLENDAETFFIPPSERPNLWDQNALCSYVVFYCREDQEPVAG